MADNDVLSNSANSTNLDIPIRSSETAGGQKIQHLRLDVGSGTSESQVTDNNPLPTYIKGSGVDVLAQYRISDLDDSTSTKYYGNLDKDGAWYILKLTSSAARYSKGGSNYLTNWTNRASLTYDYFDVVF